MPVDGDAEFLGRSLRQIASNPGFVTGALSAFGECLELPMTCGDFCVEPFDVQAGIALDLSERYFDLGFGLGLWH